MCQCGKNSCKKCTGCPPVISPDLLEDLKGYLLEAVLPGHPIVYIDDPKDIAQFNFANGKGLGAWKNWAICDGNTHDGITTPDLRNRFVVVSGSNYSVGDTGGVDNVTLTAAQSGLQNHTHNLTDPGHTHTTSGGGGATDHSHTVNTMEVSGISATSVAGATGADWTGAVLTGGSFMNGPLTTSTDPAGAPGSTTIDSASTGITIDAANSVDADEAHENRPPYYALIAVKRIK